MPEPTPNLHAANPAFHKEVRNKPERRGRTTANAPPHNCPQPGRRHGYHIRGDLRERPENDGSATAHAPPFLGGAPGATAVKVCAISPGGGTRPGSDRPGSPRRPSRP